MLSNINYFSDLKVIDLSTVLAGPSVGTFFAELGAKVIKFENPSVPDVTRSWRLAEEKSTQSSAYFASVNYKKEYRTLDLTNNVDRRMFFEELRATDILISNFKKGDAAKFGISKDLLNRQFPKLIHGKINGFGEESDRVAYDLILQAETGFMSMNGQKDSLPTKMPVALIDVLAAHQLKEGILIKLLEREKTGKGGDVSVSLYDAAVCSLANQASNYLMVNQIPKQLGSLHPNIAPYGELFTTKDNVLFTLAIGSQMHFSRLCEILEISSLSSNPKFSTNTERVENRIILHQKLQLLISTYDWNYLKEQFEKQHIPAGRINNLQSVFETDAAKQLIREEIQDEEKTLRVTQIAFKL